MKTTRLFIWVASLATAISKLAAEPPINAPDPLAPANATGKGESPPQPGPAAPPLQAAPTNAPPAASTNAALDSTGATNAASAITSTNFNPQDGLRMNFRGVPLEMVLNYMSDAAGFIIVLETDVKGRVDVWSNQPLTRDEAVNLLDSVLAKNGYAAIRNGRTLTIVARDAAKTRDIRVQKGNKPGEIPKNEEIVTQIIPVRYANALQMTKDLQMLLPTYATMTANESGNALVITDTQTSIRRMAEIVEALDTSISSISIVRVFPLQFADAKDLATAVKELFQTPNNQQQNVRNRFGGRGGGGFPGGFPGGPGGDMGGPGGGGPQGTGDSEARRAASRVVAVADERINALVVSAPDEYIPTIEQLVKDVDINGMDITELRVFHLENADPVEMADLFTQLFPDETRSTTGGNNMGFRFNRGGRGGFGGVGANNQAATSDRMKKKGRVMAVPDQRTSSIIVSAASELMPQIAEMVAQLDSSPAKKQKVYVYSVENVDPQDVQTVLRDMFQQNNTMNNRNNSTANRTSALGTRNTQSQRNLGTGTGTGFGGSGMGGSRTTGGFGQ